MPTMRSSVAGVSHSEAYAEAVAYATVKRALIDTLSFAHASIGADTELRFAQSFSDVTATLESSAPINPGQAVTFSRAGFALQLPPVGSNEKSPQITITVVGVSQEFAHAIETMVESDTPLIVTHRVYASDDLTGPHMLPVTRMEVVSARAIDAGVEITAAYADLGNTAYPRNTYKLGEYPGLAA